MFTYPLRAAVVGWLLGLGLAAVGIQFLTALLETRWLPRFGFTPHSGMIVPGVIGMLLELFWWMLAFKIAVEAMRSAASGQEGARGRELWIDDEQAARQVLLWGLGLFTGYLLYLHLGGIALGLYCLLLAPVLPAILILLGMEGSLRVAFDAGAWRSLVQSIGTDYALAAVKLALLALLFGYADVEFFWQQPRWLRVLLERLALLYILVAVYYELGRMLDQHRGNVQSPRDEPMVQAEVVSEQEQLALRAVDRLVGEGRFARAARELEPLVVADIATAAAHARFRELLARAGDQATLLLHSRHYIPLLLARNAEDEALAMYLESVEADAKFELADASALGKLIAVVVHEQLPELAIALAQEFLQRFPDEPDAVPHGLAAARLLDRLGREEQARLLLADLARRFPEHPLRGELLAALETLEHAARRGR